jgi:hypothetical protein
MVLEMEKVISIITLLLLIPLVCSITQEEIQILIQSAEERAIEMHRNNINTIRYNDTLLLAKQLYLLQLETNNSDFSQVKNKLDELEEIYHKSYQCLDELRALKSTIDQTEGIDLEPVMELYRQSEEEFHSERYEQCLSKIEQTYEKLSEMEAVETKLRVFYEVTSRSLKTFLKARWKEITIVALSILIIYLLTRKHISNLILTNRIKSLEIRKKSIKKLVQKTQKEYFEDGKISEATYKIRTKKYGELIRDINRQIPLLREQLELKRKKI